MSKTQIFIEKARAVHGDLYGYDHVVYVRNRDKVLITCKQHGDFEQRPKDHLAGQGCAKCAFESTAAKKTQKTKDGFIERSHVVHGDKYDYLKTVYVHSQEKIIITCKIHGDFEQTPAGHLMGKGCVKCSGRYNYSTQEWIQEAVAVHGDRYDYSRVVYTRTHEKVIITCAKHGDFHQTPASHLMGRGCPSCPARYCQPTNLYLMHNGLGKVKVGYAIDLNRRIAELNRDAPFEAELLETWTLPDTQTVRKIEGKIHLKLAKYHAGLSGFEGATEWFNASPDTARKHILDAIRGSHVIKNYVKNNPQMSLI